MNSNLKMTYLDNDATRGAKQMIAWADEKIAAAAAGEIFQVPIGHEKFMERVYEVRMENEDILLENAALVVAA